MFNKIPKSVAIPSLIVFLITAYLLFNPFIFRDINTIIYPRHINDLQTARNYYQILSSVLTILFSIVGLILGYFYYINKIETDANNAKRERIRKRLDSLIAELNEYDDLVNTIICLNVKDKDELKFIRNKINRSNEQISSQLEQGDTLFGLSKDEIKTIIRIHSFVEQNPFLMEVDYDELIKSDQSLIWIIKNDYTERMQEARRICYCKLE